MVACDSSGSATGSFSTLRHDLRITNSRCCTHIQLHFECDTSVLSRREEKSENLESLPRKKNLVATNSVPVL